MKLIGGLGGEEVRWTEGVQQLQKVNQVSARAQACDMLLFF
jgi:hypothetical protein